MNDAALPPFELTPGPAVCLPPAKPLVRKVVCDECKGDGFDPDEPDGRCYVCGGDGYWMEEKQAKGGGE